MIFLKQISGLSERNGGRGSPWLPFQVLTRLLRLHPDFQSKSKDALEIINLSTVLLLQAGFGNWGSFWSHLERFIKALMIDMISLDSCLTIVFWHGSEEANVSWGDGFRTFPVRLRQWPKPQYEERPKVRQWFDLASCESTTTCCQMRKKTSEIERLFCIFLYQTSS